jgi:beta-galactosidase
MRLPARFVRKALNILTPYLDFICFYLLFPGGSIYAIAQHLYIVCFDWIMRQKTKSWRTGKVPSADWEDPAVISRNRCRVRSTCTSFRNKDILLNALHNKSLKGAVKSEVMMLTGEPGIPDEVHKWDFLLVGCPTECPHGWNEEEYEVLRNRNSWNTVALPNHWQLQGFDVPIYTNTTYPFAFDPPRARRNGHWVDAACDQGLGAATSAVFPAPLHPQEPGENATGLYRRKFTLSDLVKDMDDLGKSRFFLVFAGVDSCMTMWLDGQYVGYSQDSCLPAEFDVTQICRSKRDASAEHTLAVQVSRWCDGSYLEDQDKWWLSGIYREVYIERRPAVFLSDFEFSSTVRTRETVPRPIDSGYITPGRSVLSADIIVSVLGEGVRTTSAGSASPFTPSPQAHAVRVEFWANIGDKKPVAVFTKEFASGHHLPNRIAADSIYADRKGGFGEKTASITSPGVATVKGTLTEPLLWTAETPFLYTLVVSLHASLSDASADVDSLHAQSLKVGVRKVSIGGPDNVLRINDCPVTIAGINRHEFSPKTGRAVTKASMREDAILLKKLNFNAVRSAHYPQHPYWLEVCDEVGLYVIDEANIETHGFQVLGQPVGYLSSRPEWELALTSRVTRMYERDKNHACVIGWSLGNESGHGKTHDNMAHWLRLRDPHRFVQVRTLIGPTSLHVAFFSSDTSKCAGDVFYSCGICLCIAVRVGWGAHGGDGHHLSHVPAPALVRGAGAARHQASPGHPVRVRARNGQLRRLSGHLLAALPRPQVPPRTGRLYLGLR